MNLYDANLLTLNIIHYICMIDNTIQKKHMTTKSISANYLSPNAETVEVQNEGILCNSTNSIYDITFEFDETIKE